MNYLFTNYLSHLPNILNAIKNALRNLLGHCYEQYSGEYISSPDFMQQLIGMGFRARVRARVRATVRVRAKVLQQQRQR